MARKLTRKQVVYLWAIGYFKRAPTWAPGSLKASIAKGRVKGAVSVKKVPSRTAHRDVSKETALIDRDIYGSIGDDVRIALKKPFSKESQDLFNQLLETPRFLNNQYPEVVQAMRKLVEKPSKQVEKQTEAEEPTRKARDFRDIASIKSVQDADLYVRDVTKELLEKDGQLRKVPHNEPIDTKRYDLEYAYEKADYNIEDKQARELVKSGIIWALAKYGEARADSMMDRIREGADPRQVMKESLLGRPIEYELDIDPSVARSTSINLKNALPRLTEMIPLDTVQGLAYIPVERAESGRAFYSKGSLSLEDGSKEQTVAHEFAHYLEDNSPSWRHVADTYIDATADKARGTRSIAELTGNPLYRSNEVGYFPKPGKKVVHPYVLKHYGDKEKTSHTEVLSMGLEHMYADPARFFREAPDHFRTTLTALHTPTLRTG